MTTHDDGPTTGTTSQYGEAVSAAPAMPAPAVPTTGPGIAFPATASGVPLSVFAFGFSVGILGLIDTGILSGGAVPLLAPLLGKRALCL